MASLTSDEACSLRGTLIIILRLTTNSSVPRVFCRIDRWRSWRSTLQRKEFSFHVDAASYWCCPTIAPSVRAVWAYPKLSQWTNDKSREARGRCWDITRPSACQSTNQNTPETRRSIQTGIATKSVVICHRLQHRCYTVQHHFLASTAVASLLPPAVIRRCSSLLGQLLQHGTMERPSAIHRFAIGCMRLYTRRVSVLNSSIPIAENVSRSRSYISWR